MARTKEKRGNSLLGHVRECIPGCGHLKLEGHDGRKASFVFQALHYQVSSRLTVKENELGLADTPMTEELSQRLKGVTV